MPIDYDALMTMRFEDERYSWSDRDAMLYALAIGMGADPLDQRELPFVYENGLKAVPTLATTVAFGIRPVLRLGLNYAMVVHGEQSITLHRTFAPEGELIASTTLPAVWDKGPGRGAVLLVERQLRDLSGEPLATLRSTVMARGDGGFGGPSGGAPEPQAMPQRAPDVTLDLATRPDQALLYRLCGDRNPLHADPGFAQAVGFPRPILHGLCAYGIACRAVLATFADYDPSRIRSHTARFSAPVFPGETLGFDLWREGDVVLFEARVRDRDAVVLKGGRTELASAG